MKKAGKNMHNFNSNYLWRVRIEGDRKDFHLIQNKLDCRTFIHLSLFYLCLRGKGGDFP